MSESEVLYKVILVKDGHGVPCHGGAADFVWPLPTDDGPGDWVTIPGPLQLCQNALHGTDSPVEWWVPDSVLCVMETRGEIQREGTKTGALEARLTTFAPWSEHDVWTEGEHTVTSGLHRATDSTTVWAYGSATVWAYGSATVRAYDSATVRAYDSASVVASGSASVRAYDSARVEAYDSASVVASGSASVRASDSASVEAYDSATVRASGSATVVASGSATVRAYDSATVVSTIYHRDNAAVALSQMAAHVDRRNGKLVLRGARGAAYEVPQ